MFPTLRISLKSMYVMWIGSILLTSAAKAQTVPGPDQALCSRAAQMRIYSNAFFSKESGDVVGYELAVSNSADSTDALLFIYEGVANNDGIPLTSQRNGDKITVSGTWVVHGIEFPSKKEIVARDSVMIDGLLSAKSLAGHIAIGDPHAPKTLRMKRVQHLWLCN